MGNTATDNKSEEVVDKSSAKTEAKASEKKPEEKKTATTAAAKTAEKKTPEKKPEEKKQEEKKAEDKKVEDSKPEEKKQEDKPASIEGAESKPEPQPEPEAQPEAEHKQEDVPVAAQPSTEENTKDQYPYDVILRKSISTYRGPSIELLNKPFGGKLTVLGVTGNFYKVQFVRAGFGTVVAYVLCEEVKRWAS